MFRRGGVNLFPLYVYPNQNSLIQSNRTLNLNLDELKIFEKKLGLELNEDIVGEQYFKPSELIDYIYATLHSVKYREKYKEFLKNDFPRIPYPKNKDVFWSLVTLGDQLRKLHLMEGASLKTITQYPKDGQNIIEKRVYKNGNVYINDEQYFANVSELVWNFYIGGYQPAQEWLKSRHGQALQFEDIKHYQKIIATLQRTSELMEEIDKIDFM